MPKATKTAPNAAKKVFMVTSLTQISKWYKSNINTLLGLTAIADRDVAEPLNSAAAADFNPRGPCGPRQSEVTPQPWTNEISILAVLADRNLRLAV